MSKNRVLTSLLLGTGSKVKVKFLACSSRYEGLGFAGCSKEQQSSLPVFDVCVSVISGRMLIIMRMWSIGL